MTVLPRSYSRQIGATWCESETGTSGKRSRRNSRARLVGGVDVGEEEADGDSDGPSALAASRSATRSASPSRSSGSSTPPSSSSRSATPQAVAALHSGLGLRQWKS